MRQTKERLAKRLENDSYEDMGRIVVRADGLAFRRVGRTRHHWWCAWCDGKKPEAWRKGKADSLEKVYLEWDLHRESLTHKREVGVRRATDGTVDALVQLLSDGEG